MKIYNCNFCKHREKGVKCAAYPEGIPREILKISDSKLYYKECKNGIKCIPRIDPAFSKI